jgi:hypothetical protein
MALLELFSPLPPEECVERLCAATDPDGGFSFFGGNPVVGRISGRTVRLRKRIYYGNSFQILFTGTLQPAGAGTMLRGRFGIQRWVWGFMVFWFAFNSLVGGILFVATLVTVLGGPMQAKGDPWVGLVVPPGLVLFGAGLLWFGRYLARDEPEFLRGFLVEVLEASCAATPERGSGSGQKTASDEVSGLRGARPQSGVDHSE